MEKRRRWGAPFYESTVQDGDCLRWTATRNKAGYGKFYDRTTGKVVLAHRYIYEQEIGPIPDGLHLDHVWERGCRFRDCVKVSHLEPVTPRTNVSRAAPARQTQCKNGHEYNSENTYYRDNGNGIRQCRKCHADNERRRRENQKVQRTDNDS